MCPHCGYAALERHFPTVTVNGKAEVLKKITPKWKKRDFSGTRDLKLATEIHKLVLLNYTVMHYPFHEIAKLCLKLSWFYRYVGDSQEQGYLKHAYDMFEKSFINEPIDEDPNNESNILYLMGEIARQLEDYKKSVEWFGMALQNGRYEKQINSSKKWHVINGPMQKMPLVRRKKKAKYNYLKNDRNNLKLP